MKLIVISGPSGVGKSTVVDAVVRATPELTLGTSLTTRRPRANDRPGRYQYVTRTEFHRRLQAGDLWEHVAYNGDLYGSLRPALENPVLLEIDVQGAAQIKQMFPDAQLIFMVTPGATITEQLQVLAERLRRRDTDSSAAVTARLAQAERELRQGQEQSDIIIVNSDLRQATEETIAAIKDYLPTAP